MTAMRLETEGNLARIFMPGPENRINLDFAREMLGMLDQIAADPRISAVLLDTDHPKNWCLGMDVEWLSGRMGAGDGRAISDCLTTLNQAFERMLTYPMPIVACICGHVAAGGLVLAAACDFRFMRADQGWCLLPEVDLGIPFLPGMIAITKKAVPYDLFEYLKYTGLRIDGRRMAERHVVLEAVSGADALRERAAEFAGALRKERTIFGEMKRRMHAGILEAMARDDPPYIQQIASLARPGASL